MIKSILQKLPCAKCNKPIGKNSRIYSSDTMPGTYLVACPHCYSPLLTAGQNLVSMPMDTSNPLAEELQKELMIKMSDEASEELYKSELPENIKDVLGNILDCIQDKTITSIENKEKIFNSAKAVKTGNVISFEPSNNDNDISIMEEENVYDFDIFDDEEELIQTKPTTHVVLVDGDVYDEYTEDASMKDIFNDVVKEFGIDSIMDGSVQVCELKPIMPKVKTKTIYELDM